MVSHLDASLLTSPSEFEIVHFCIDLKEPDIFCSEFRDF